MPHWPASRHRECTNQRAEGHATSSRDSSAFIIKPKVGPGSVWMRISSVGRLRCFGGSDVLNIGCENRGGVFSRMVGGLRGTFPSSSLLRGLWDGCFFPFKTWNVRSTCASADPQSRHRSSISGPTSTSVSVLFALPCHVFERDRVGLVHLLPSGPDSFRSDVRLCCVFLMILCRCISSSTTKRERVRLHLRSCSSQVRLGSRSRASLNRCFAWRRRLRTWSPMRVAEMAIATPTPTEMAIITVWLPPWPCELFLGKIARSMSRTEASGIRQWIMK